MIAKLLLQNLIWIVVMGALLFVPAGTPHWPAAWVFLGTIAMLGISCGLWLARTDPALLAERMHPMMQRDQPAADNKFMLAFGIVALIRFFAIPVIRLQTERGHRVVSTGPYAWVRHPMYSGTVLFFVGAPMLLGSWWGVAIAPLFVVLFAIRAGIEERALIAGLPGYADYTARVRYRLVPGLW